MSVWIYIPEYMYIHTYIFQYTHIFKYIFSDSRANLTPIPLVFKGACPWCNDAKQYVTASGWPREVRAGPACTHVSRGVWKIFRYAYLMMLLMEKTFKACWWRCSQIIPQRHTHTLHTHIYTYILSLGGYNNKYSIYFIPSPFSPHPTPPESSPLHYSFTHIWCCPYVHVFRDDNFRLGLNHLSGYSFFF